MDNFQTNAPEETEERRVPKMEDVGTRYEHLLDYKDSLEICMEIVKRRGGDQRSLAKFIVAIDVLNITIDAFSGYNETTTEYSLYKLLNSVPRSKDALKSIGGTPLE